MATRTIVLLGIALFMLAGCGKSKEAYEKSFKESFLKSFVKSCTESATKGGLKADVAQTKCECSGKYMVDKYSSTELTKLSVGNSAEAQKIIEEAVNACK